MSMSEDEDDAPKEEGLGYELHEVGDLAVWSVTTAKPGNGVGMLRDGSTETFWQSDGAQPHLINIQFHRRVDLLELHLYMDFRTDESYTPQQLLVRAGNSVQELKDLQQLDLKEPCGWVVVPLSPTVIAAAQGGDKDKEAAAAAGQPEPLKTFFLQVAVLSNHQNGRDTHIRCVEVYGPRHDAAVSGPQPGLDLCTPEMTMYNSIR